MVRLAKISVRNETPKILKSSALKYWDSWTTRQIHYIPVKHIPFGNPPRQVELHAEINKQVGPSTPRQRRRQHKHNGNQHQPCPAGAAPSGNVCRPARQVHHSKILCCGHIPVNLFRVAGVSHTANRSPARQRQVKTARRLRQDKTTPLKQMVDRLKMGTGMHVTKQGYHPRKWTCVTPPD